MNYGTLSGQKGGLTNEKIRHPTENASDEHEERNEVDASRVVLVLHAFHLIVVTAKNSHRE